VRRVVVIAAFAALALMLGGFHQWDAQASSKTTLTVSPASPTVGSTFTLSGCGYPKGKLISIGAGPSGTSFEFHDVTPDAQGCVSTMFTAWRSGEWYAGAWFVSAPYRTLVDWFDFDVS
jgi:hypothetical protein